MRLSWNWLNDFVDCRDVSPDQCAERLTSAGLEVAGIESRRLPDKVVAGLVRSIRSHPRADKLVVCSVDIGKTDMVDVVCGAPNVSEGMLAPLALPGAILSRSFQVQKAEIRGVVSGGMLCSERELGLSPDHSGLMELDGNELTPGTAFNTVIPDDTVLEIELTPNRGDCLSVLGIAREISALFNKPLHTPRRRPEEKRGNPQESIAVTVQNTQACPRYCGRVVRALTMQHSPLWLKVRLMSAGIRPINIIVDITNYIMVAYGHPMHAFDYNDIAQKRIDVGNAEDMQKFVTLDNVTHTLTSEDLLIWDGEKPIALAGIMGGANSGINENTTDVFLECAYFDPVTIRKTAKHLSISTDSSYRFERGVDYGTGLVSAIDEAAFMLQSYAGGEVVGGFIDKCSIDLKPRTVSFRAKRASALLGVTLDSQTCTQFLASLGIGLLENRDTESIYAIPTFRHDCTQEVDLIEEVGRLFGYDSIPSAETAEIPLGRPAEYREETEDAIRRVLAYSGINEIVTTSLTAEKYRGLLTPSLKSVVLLNPLSPETAEMRTSLIGTALQTLAYNNNRKNENNRFFELGYTYHYPPGSDAVEEQRKLVLLIQGNYLPKSWLFPGLPASFYVCKGILENLVTTLQWGDLVYSSLADTTIFTHEAAHVVGKNGIHGILGRIQPRIAEAFGVKSAVFCAELTITPILEKRPDKAAFGVIPKYPAIERDLCFVMPSTTLAGDLLRDMSSLADIVESAEIFDLYEGEKIESGWKSVAYSIRLRSSSRTLTDKDADRLCRTIIETAQRKYNAVLRS